MEHSDIRQLQLEVFDKGREAALPCNLPDKWLGMLARDLRMLPPNHEDSYKYLSAPLVVISFLLLGKADKTGAEVSFSMDELNTYLQYLEIELTIEIARRANYTDAIPATLETIFTQRAIC